MRQRKTKPDSEQNHALNGTIKTSSKSSKTNTRNNGNQQLLLYVLYGFFGLIFSVGLLIFVTRNLYSFSRDVWNEDYDWYEYERTKSEVVSDSEHKKSESVGKNPQENTEYEFYENSNGDEKNNVENENSINLKDKTAVKNELQNKTAIKRNIESGWRKANEKDLAKYGSSLCNIERRRAEGLSTEEFETSYRFKKPVIVQFANGAADWTDPDKWTLSSLKREYGHYIIYSGNAREIVRRGGNGEVDSSVSDFVDKLITKKDETGEPLYVFDRNFYNSSSLPKTLKPPEYFKIQDGVDDSIFFLGASKSGVSFHKHADSWNGVVFGRKRWFLYPIEHTPPGGVFTGYTMLEWYDKIYPKLITEQDKPLECIQEAGEILYLPEGYYHGTINLGDTVAIGIQRKECTIEIQKLFYQDGDLFNMMDKSASEAEKESWTLRLIDLYTKLSKLLPGNTEIMNNLASLYHSVERYRASMDMIDRILKIDPYFVIAMLQKSDLLLEANKYEETEQILQEALQLNPELFDTRIRYGHLLYTLERYHEAIYHYKKATELRPTDISFLNHLKEAQSAAGDTKGVEETNELINYKFI